MLHIITRTCDKTSIQSKRIVNKTECALRCVNSVLKNMDVTTLNVIEMVKSGNFSGGLTVGTLENGGVGIAPYHELSSSVSSELASEVETLRKGIISGSIKMN